MCIAARAFSAICALQAVLIGFFSVKIDVGSTGISSHFLIDIQCRGPSVPAYNVAARQVTVAEARRKDCIPKPRTLSPKTDTGVSVHTQSQYPCVCPERSNKDLRHHVTKKYVQRDTICTALLHLGPGAFIASAENAWACNRRRLEPTHL